MGAPIFTFFGRPKFKRFGAPRYSNFSGRLPVIFNWTGAPLWQNFPQQDFLSAAPREPTPPRPSRQFSAGFSSAERPPKNERRVKKPFVFIQFLCRRCVPVIFNWTGAPLWQNFPQQDFLSAAPREPTPPRPSRQFSAGFSSAEGPPINETRVKKPFVFTQLLGRRCVPVIFHWTGAPLRQNFPQQDFLSATPQEPTPPRPSRQFSAGFSSAESSRSLRPFLSLLSLLLAAVACLLLFSLCFLFFFLV